MTHFNPKSLSLATLWMMGMLSCSTKAMADDTIAINHILLNQNQIAIEAQQARNQALFEQLVPNPTAIVDYQDQLNKTVSGLHTTQMANADNANNTDNQTICFPIHSIRYAVLSKSHLTDAKQLRFALMLEATGKHRIIGQCLTAQDINALATRVQNRLIDKGYITSRVLIADQNLSEGKLQLTLIPGRIGQIMVETSNSKIPVYLKTSTTPVQPAILSTALTTQTGKLLNIRDLESTLENFKRIPSSDADFKILPSSKTNLDSDNKDKDLLGLSDILINYQQSRRIRGSLSLDDSGSKSTGKYQGTATLSVDNLANFNDLLYFTFGRDLGNQLNTDQDSPSDMSKGSKNYGLGYVLPIKNTLLQINANHYTYHQTVAGSTQDYIYGGNSKQYNAKLSHLIHRNKNSKSHLHIGGYAKSQESDIDGTTIDVQTRKIAGHEFGISHERTLGQKGNHTVTADLTYKRGTGAFGALPSPEELFNEGSARVGIYQLNASLDSKYQPIINQSSGKPTNLVYRGKLRVQYATDSLTPDLKMAIGGRYTVRGFDGERSLSADNGILLKQDFSVYPNFLNQNQANNAIYLGLDAGFISNKDKSQNELLLGQHLVGAAIGVKGQYTPNKNNPYFSFNYDIFTSKALNQPKGFSDKDWVSGVSLGFNF